VDIYILYALVPFVGLAVGLGLALLVRRRPPAEREDLLAEARAKRDDRIRAARSQALEERAEAEALARQLLTATLEVEQRLARREERLEGRLDSVVAREATADARDAEQEARHAAVNAVYEQEAAALQQIQALSRDAARATLLEEVAPSVRDVTLSRAEALLAESEELAGRVRARPTALAVQRSSSDVVGEYALVPVPIPREEIKGRIIGREGRNIKAFEAMTGVELVIDDAPDVVTLSGFDPYRREVARLALLDLVDDGRIHPGRIEEIVKRTRETLLRKLREDGLKAAETAGVGHVQPDIAELLGRLQLMRDDAEDALQRAIRLAGLAATVAAELKADARVARRAALLYDLGRAVGREAGGSTETISADVLARAGEPPAVIAAVTRPAEMYPSLTPEQAAVWLARAVAETGLAARDDSPVRRVDAVERTVALVDGISDVLAFQVGTRVRVLIRSSESLDTLGRLLRARTVLERIDASLGSRVGLTIAFLASPSRRRGHGDGVGAHASPQGNGAAKLDTGRPAFRGRHGRRGG
jgi:ribonuclease Y